MPKSKSIERLHRVRELQEEMHKRGLITGQAQLARLKYALVSMSERVDRGRAILFSALQSNDLCDRLAGQSEIESGTSGEAHLRIQWEELALHVQKLRSEYMDKRVEKLQVQTLLDAVEARMAVEAERKAQQSLDDWFLNRRGNEAQDDCSNEIEHKK